MVKGNDQQTEGQKLLKQLRDEYGKPQRQAQRHTSESAQAVPVAESCLEPSLPL